MEVMFSCPVNGALVADLIEAMVSHVMHMRGQIPVPIQLLHQYSQSMQQTGKIKSELQRRRIERKIDEFLERYHEIVAEVRQLAQNHRILEVGILFGPAPRNPREGYFLHFSSFQSEQEVPESIRKAACRKCIRKFLEFWSQDLPNSPPVVSTFLSVRLSNENKISEEFPMNSEFSLRDDFSPQFRRKGLQPVHLFIQSSNEQTLTQEEVAQHGVLSRPEMISHDIIPPQSSLNNSSEHWLVLARGIKGIKSLKIDS